MDHRSLTVGLTTLAATFALVGWGTVSPDPTRSGSSHSATDGRSIVAWRPCHQPGERQPGVLDAFRMGAVDFVDATTGVALTAGSYQCFHRVRGGVESSAASVPEQLATTDDGGHSWVLSGVPLPRVSATSDRWPERIVTDGSTVWAVSGDGRPFVTTDRGRTWRALSLPRPVVGLAAAGDGYLWALSCPASGAVSCVPELSRMRLNSGRWTPLPVPRLDSVSTQWAPLPGGNAVVSVMRAGRPRGALLISARHGQRWRSRPAPNWQGRPCNVAALASSNRELWLLCLGRGAGGQSPKALMVSNDGGASWQIRSSVASILTPVRPGQISRMEPSALGAGSPHRLWLALQNGLAVSSDGGRSWSSRPSVNGQGEVTVIDALSSTHAWLIAPGAGLWRTTDGTHWAPLGPLNTG